MKNLIMIIAVACAFAVTLGVVFIAGATIGRSFAIRVCRFALRKCRHLFHIRQSNGDILYPVMTDVQRKQISDAVKLSFVGDLILLREMVERAHKGDGKYDFTPVFSACAEIFKSADLCMGVFEGPLAGAEFGYSTSNYDDGVPLRLNFPDSFAQAVKSAGIGFVTTANNHLLDRGVYGAMRTLDVLDSIGLAHTGSFRSLAEKLRPCIVEVKGLRIGVLAYTYGSEYCTEESFFEESRRNLTRLIVDRKSPYFKKCVEDVRRDFEFLRKEKPDLIIAMPHMGVEFAHRPSDMQRYWAKLFITEGANVVFADHPHAVQPVEWIANGRGGKSVIVYCPGNFVNSYTEHDGDASMITEVYIDANTARPIAASIVPLYAYCGSDGNYGAVPVSDLLDDNFWREKLSIGERKRIEEVQKIVTESALGVDIVACNRERRYFTFPETGYARQTVAPLDGFDIAASPLLSAIRESSHVCFVGDSITEGTKNGGYAWYEPIAAMFPGKKFERYAKGGETSVWLRAHVSDIVSLKADLYVVAIGCNDIRYRDSEKCAISPEAYISNLSALRDAAPLSRFVFVAPWFSRYFDPYCNVPLLEKKDVYLQYINALEQYSKKIKAIFINPNSHIDLEGKHKEALVDHIHPGAHDGIRVFSSACITPPPPLSSN